MHLALLVGIVKRLGQLTHHLFGFKEGKGLRARAQPFGQGATCHIFLGDVGDARCLAGVKDLDNVGMTQARRLAPRRNETAHIVSILRQMGRQNLQGDDAIIERIKRPVDGGANALPDDSLDSVGADLLWKFCVVEH